MTTLKEYWDYKNRVEAKANGANIHKVNGLLSIVANAVDALERNAGKAKTPQLTQWEIEDLNRIERTTKQIAVITGVHP